MSQLTAPDVSQMLTALPVGVLFVNSSYEILICNEAAQRLLGFPERDLIGRSTFDPIWDVVREDGSRFPPDEFPVPLAINTGESVRNVVMGLARPGATERIWLLVDAVPQRDPGGAIQGAVCTFGDISEFRHTRLALRETEERYQHIVETAEEGIWLVDTAARITFANAAMARMLGTTADNLIGRPVWEFMESEARAIAERNLARAQRGIREQFDFCFRRLDGTPVWTIVSSHPLVDDAGRFTGKMAIVTDVTARKIAEQELHRHYDELQAVVEASPLAIVTIAHDDKVLSWNTAAERIFGYTASEVIGNPLPIIPPDRQDEHRTMQWRVAHQDWFTGVETTRLRKNGLPVAVSVSTAPLHAVDGSVTGCVAVYEDITARLQTEEELRRASRMEATATLAAGIAHDFNNLMTGILANAQLLRRDLRLDGEPDEMLEDIGRAALRAGELAQQLLAFARGGKYMPRIINLNEVLVESARLQKGFSPAVRREQVLAPDLWEIDADPVQMSQVVMNLALNAVEAIEGSGFVRMATCNQMLNAAEAAKLGLKPGRYVCLSVEDSGSGMDEATRARVFEPFFSTKFQGRGLGLAAVYGIVKNHSGDITVSSTPGKGTTFRVLLPAAEERAGTGRPEVIG